MSMNQAAMKAAIDKSISPAGFKQNKDTWYRNTPAALQIVDLQKSAYGGQYYLNICFVPEGMTVVGMPTPPEHKCPIRIRIDSLFPTLTDQVRDILNLEKQMLDATSRSRGIESILTDALLPFLNSIQQLQDLRIAIGSGPLRDAAILISARTHLRLDS